MAPPTQQNVVTGLDRSFGSVEDTDFMIKCGEVTWHVHKGVLSVASPFFKACINGFKESAQGFVTMNEEDPAVIQHALTHIYGCLTGVKRRSLDLYNFPIVRLHAFADKYSIYDLWNATLEVTQFCGYCNELNRYLLDHMKVAFQYEYDHLKELRDIFLGRQRLLEEMTCGPYADSLQELATTTSLGACLALKLAKKKEGLEDDAVNDLHELASTTSFGYWLALKLKDERDTPKADAVPATENVQSTPPSLEDCEVKPPTKRKRMQYDGHRAYYVIHD